MQEYEVKIYETVSHTTIVSAENEEEAYTKAYEVIGNGQDNEYTTEAEGFTGDVSIEELTS